MENIKLTKTQQTIFDTIVDLAKSDRDVKGFLCLPVSGKSFLFRYIEDYFRDKGAGATLDLKESISPEGWVNHHYYDSVKP